MLSAIVKEEFRNESFRTDSVASIVSSTSGRRALMSPTDTLSEPQEAVLCPRGLDGKKETTITVRSPFWLEPSHESSRLHRTRLPSVPPFSFFSPVHLRSSVQDGTKEEYLSPARVSLGRSPEEFPEIIRKSRRSPPFSVFGAEPERNLPPLVHLYPLYARSPRNVRTYTRVGYVAEPQDSASRWRWRRSCLLFPAVSFLPAGMLIYSAHKRCSQITVPFMTLLLHR